MPWSVWKSLHSQIGTYRESGGQLIPGTWALNTDAISAVTPGVDAAFVMDEDLQTAIQPLPDAGPYTLLHFISNQAVFTTGSIVPYLNNGTEIQYNPSGSSIAVVGGNNRWVNVYGILVPVATDSTSQQYRILWIQGQTFYTSAASAVAEDFRSLNLGNLTQMFPEFVPFIRLTLRRTLSYGNTYRVQIDTGPTYITGSRSSLVTVSGFTPSSHNSLTDLQGGVAGEYYHLTLSQQEAATRIASSSQSGLLSAEDWNTFNNPDLNFNVDGGEPHTNYGGIQPIDGGTP
jgi:hypothetical protein